MNFDYITDSWMDTASEEELRAAEDELSSYLDQLDYDSDEHTRLSNIQVDGWYLPNDD